jgi:hypothetical protein
VGAIYRQWRITGRQAQAHGPSGRRRAIRGRLSIWTMDLSPTVELGGLTMLDRYQDQLAPGPERRDWVPPCGTYERLDNPCRPALIAACERPRSISHNVWGGA